MGRAKGPFTASRTLSLGARACWSQRMEKCLNLSYTVPTLHSYREGGWSCLSTLGDMPFLRRGRQALSRSLTAQDRDYQPLPEFGGWGPLTASSSSILEEGIK